MRLSKPSKWIWTCLVISEYSKHRVPVSPDDLKRNGCNWDFLFRMRGEGKKHYGIFVVEEREVIKNLTDRWPRNGSSAWQLFFVFIQVWGHFFLFTVELSPSFMFPGCWVKKFMQRRAISPKNEASKKSVRSILAQKEVYFLLWSIVR